MRPSPAEYLQPGYNPSKLTISELTSILSSHEISVPSSRQQKQYYLDLFQELLAPLGPKILFDLENIVPSNKGIKKMATGQKLTMLDSNDNKRADFESETRSSKRIKSLLMESPSKLPIAKAKKGSPRRSAIALPAHDQDIECPKQDRFSINPTLPGVRDTVTSPAYEKIKSVAERTKEYERVMQEEAERAKPLIAPSAEYHCRECLEATIDAKLERGTQTSAWWLVFGVFMAILPTVIYGIFWAPDRAQELLDNGLFFLEDTFMPVAQWFQRQRGFQEAVRFLQPVIDDLQFSFQRAGQYIQPVIEDLRLVAQRAIDHVSFENLMMLKTDIDFMLKSTALKVVDELLKFCVAIGNSYNYYFTEYCAPAFERMAFSLKYILDKFESDFVGPIADSVAPLLEVAIKNVEPAANFALSYWRSALAFIIESGVYNAFLANFQLFKSYASELLETMEFGVLNGFFESIGYVELGLIGAWFGAMGLIYVILPI